MTDQEARYGNEPVSVFVKKQIELYQRERNDNDAKTIFQFLMRSISSVDDASHQTYLYALVSQACNERDIAMMEFDKGLRGNQYNNCNLIEKSHISSIR